jgi:hypothetical protein
LVRGVAVNLSSEASARAETGLTDDEWMATNYEAFDALASSGEFPAFGRMIEGFGEAGFDFDLNEVFEFALRTYLDGLTPVIEGSRS